MAERILQFETPDGPLTVPVTACVVAGWTGRDRAAIDHHIEELAAIGVPGPSTVPLFYRVSAEQLTQAERIQVLGSESSGEVEPVLVACEQGLFLTVGSDHTDRKVETYSIAVSKQMCPKVLATAAWPVDLDADLDSYELASEARIDGADTPYQRGTFALIRPLRDLVGQEIRQARLDLDDADRAVIAKRDKVGSAAIGQRHLRDHRPTEIFELTSHAPGHRTGDLGCPVRAFVAFGGFGIDIP